MFVMQQQQVRGLFTRFTGTVYNVTVESILERLQTLLCSNLLRHVAGEEKTERLVAGNVERTNLSAAPEKVTSLPPE